MGKCGTSPTSPLKAEEAGAVSLHCLHCVLNLQKPPPLSASPKVDREPRSTLPPPSPASAAPSTSLAVPAMATKSDKAKSDKAKKEKSDKAAKLAAMRKRMVVFSPRLGARELRDKYYLFW